MGDSENKQGLGDIYIKASDPEDRKKLIETLEVDGYKLDEELSVFYSDFV